MPFTNEHLAKLRPYVYHLTAANNVQYIAEDLCIHSAEYWIRKAKRHELLNSKRRNVTDIVVGRRTISLRDQAPLYQGKMQLRDEMSFEDFVQLLNGRVFFWPGNESQPNGYGQRHFARYKSDDVSIIRIDTADLFSANRSKAPEFCRYNSGSPRPSNGVRSPRGLDTFVRAVEASFSAGKVVEVTFPHSVLLPESAEFMALGKRKWRKLRRA